MDKIFLVSKRSIQNDMLASFIEEQTGNPCSTAPGAQPALMAARIEEASLVLWDCSAYPLQELWEAIASINGQADRIRFALINAASDKDLELEALEKGAHGIFSRSDDISLMIQGIKAILGRELWFPRRALSAYLSNSRRDMRPAVDQRSEELTAREREILSMVATGLSNKDISEQLCISVSTVKSHLYNIYAKIEAPNRTQAALWAARNL